MVSRSLFGLLPSAALSAPALTAEPALTPKEPEVPPQLAPKPDWVQPPGKEPRVGRERSYNLDTLFAALKIAPDDESARAIERLIWALWMPSGSDTCDLLMGRVKAATEQKDFELAIKLLNAVIKLNPNYTEALNRRTSMYFLQKDYTFAKCWCVSRVTSQRSPASVSSYRRLATRSTR